MQIATGSSSSSGNGVIQFRTPKRILSKRNIIVAWLMPTNISPAKGSRGWKADRGRIYIEWGQPDAIDLDGVGVAGSRQLWRYRYLEGIGENVELEFTDPRHSGEYHLTVEPAISDGRFYFDDGVELECTGCIQVLSDRDASESSQLVPQFRDL